MFRLLLSVALTSAVYAVNVRSQNVLEMVQSSPNLSTLYAAVKAAGLEDALSDTTGLTLFAPTNEAFTSEPMTDYKLKFLLDPANKGSITQIVAYHVTKAVLSVDDLKAKAGSSPPAGVSTVQGSFLLPVIASDGALEIDDATCAQAKISSSTPASNGMLHLVDAVFVPAGAICPDVLFAAEQRSDSRISVYGYDCRNRGFSHLVHGEEKPVGLAVDSETNTLFWSNDMDSPHQAPTSWITSMNFSDVSTLRKIKSDAIDPQGMEADSANQKLYFTEHSGYRVARSDYNGSNYEVLVEKPGDNCFQPSDVSVDADNNKIFFYAECPTTDAGTLWVMNMTGGNLTKLKEGLLHNYGLCLDKPHKQLFYVQGGHGGSISCLAYGDTPCVKDIVIDGLEWPYMCQIDSTWTNYGGPTMVIYSEANRPGTINYLTTQGTEQKSLKVLTSELDAPMGLSLGCLGTDAGMNKTAW